MAKNTVSSSLVKHISDLANIPITDKESEVLASAFEETLDVVDQLKKADVSGVETTHQITNFKNRDREDLVDHSRECTQEEALANAPHQYQGYFVVPQVLQNKDS